MVLRGQAGIEDFGGIFRDLTNCSVTVLYITNYCLLYILMVRKKKPVVYFFSSLSLYFTYSGMGINYSIF